jgi:hypothetical protein
MTDQTKSCLGTFFLISSIILPFVGLAVGWIGWNFKIGAIAASIIFASFFLLSGIILSTVKDLSWFTVSLPFLFGFLYSLLPDLIIGPIDDAAAVVAGAIFSFVLALKKEPDTPKWIIFPLFAAGLYTLVGTLIPGPVDESLVGAVCLGIAGYGAIKQLGSGSGEYVDAEFEVEE